jgi:hypothetical protein
LFCFVRFITPHPPLSRPTHTGIYEWSKNATPVIWTLEYQSRVIAEDVDIAIGNPNISGISLWHFFDFKTNDATENNTHCDYIPDVYPPICAYINASASDLTGRPGGLNHKGVVDFWRRLKPSYHIVAEKYNATKKKPLPKQAILPNLNFWAQLSG